MKVRLVLNSKSASVVLMADGRGRRLRALHVIAMQQGGYFSAAQAKGVGYSYQGQAHHVAAGNWQRVGRGIFRLADEPAEIHDEMFQWMLWSKGRAVVSHESALEVHDVGELESKRVHLTVPPGLAMRHRAVVLHQATIAARDIDRRNRFPVTTVLRSVIDVAALRADEDQLARVIDEALKGGHFTVRQLRERSEVFDLKGALRIERALHWIDA